MASLASHLFRQSIDAKPSPTNFDEYLAWACLALQENFYPVVARSTQCDYDTSATKGKKGRALESDLASNVSCKDNSSAEYSKSDEVNVEAIYNINNLLVQLKILNNNNVPRNLMKIISLILPFHPLLTSIYINKGLSHEGLYELAKIIDSSNITEVILDGTHIKEGNYYFILENKSNLKYLSLARCNINDVVVKELMSRLFYPLPMSKILSVLNLSSNRITNKGAQHVGEMLKTNRQLAYLNLADNMITDKGADSILNNLILFPLSVEEVLVTKTKKYAYLKEKENLIKRTLEEIVNVNLNKITSKTKADKTPGGASTRRQKDSRIRDSIFRNKFNVESFGDITEKAVNDKLGPFMHPYRSQNTVCSEGIVYCLGNNSLCYLSLAYNNLTKIAVEKLYTVFDTQYKLNRNPRGLLNVCIDGNDISESCSDLARINFMIERGLVPAEVPVVVNTGPKKKGGGNK